MTGLATTRVGEVAPIILHSYLRRGARRIGARVHPLRDGGLDIDHGGRAARLRFLDGELEATLDPDDDADVLFRARLPPEVDAVGPWSMRHAANVIHVLESLASEGAGPLRPLRLLVVDDEAILRDALVRLLPGHTVDLACSAPEARQMLADRSYDGVLLDVLMPGVTGVDLLREVRASNPTLAASICLMTAEPMTVLNETSTPVLVKPFSRQQLDSLLVWINALGGWDEADPGTSTTLCGLCGSVHPGNTACLTELRPS